jgi:hypothetical protein
METKPTAGDMDLKFQLEDADIQHLAAQLNATFDVPFIPEHVEQIWIEWVLAKVLTVIPADIVRFVVDASDGLTEAEIAKYEVSLTSLVNSIIDLPVLTESMEAAIIRPIVNQLLSFAVKGKALTLAP